MPSRSPGQKEEQRHWEERSRLYGCRCRGLAPCDGDCGTHTHHASDGGEIVLDSHPDARSSRRAATIRRNDPGRLRGSMEAATPGLSVFRERPPHTYASQVRHRGSVGWNLQPHSHPFASVGRRPAPRNWFRRWAQEKGLEAVAYTKRPDQCGDDGGTEGFEGSLAHTGAIRRAFGGKCRLGGPTPRAGGGGGKRRPNHVDCGTDTSASVHRKGGT